MVKFMRKFCSFRCERSKHGIQ